jgi:hypothetical protein
VDDFANAIGEAIAAMLGGFDEQATKAAGDMLVLKG